MKRKQEETKKDLLGIEYKEDVEESIIGNPLNLLVNPPKKPNFGATQESEGSLHSIILASFFPFSFPLYSSFEEG